MNDLTSNACQPPTTPENPTVLFLDDCPFRTRIFKREFPFASTFETAEGIIRAIKEGGHVDYLFLDHDLGGDVFVDSSRDDCGMEVVRWIVANAPRIGKIVVHSCNGPAAVEMEQELRRAGYDVFRRSFPFLDLGTLLP